MNKKLTLLLGAALIPGVAAQAALKISELRVDESGTDANEWFEISGTPGESLDDVWYIVLGDHSNFNNPDTAAPYYGSGVVEYALDLSGFEIPADGYFLCATTTFQIDNYGVTVDDIDYEVSLVIFENSDNVTHCLVRGYKGSQVTQPSDQWGDLAVDIDPTDSGVLVDPLPWDETIDAIGLVEIPNDSTDPAPEELVYGELLGFEDIGPDGAFVPGTVYRGNNDGAWNIGLFGQFTEVDGKVVLRDDASDTPGAANIDSPEQNATLPNPEDFEPFAAAPGMEISIVGSDMAGATEVLYGTSSVAFTVVSDSEITFTVPGGAVAATVTVTTPAGTTESGDMLQVYEAGLGVIVAEDFESGFGDFTAESVASNADWATGSFSGNGYVAGNGYGADEASDDYLISPTMDLTGITNAVMSFTTARNFDGPDLQVFISTSYNSSLPVDDAGQNWVELTGLTVSTGSYEMVNSGPIALTGYANQMVTVAFRYTSAGTASGEGAVIQLHDFLVLGGQSTVVGDPEVEDFAPFAAAPGQLISIIGENLATTTDVSFGTISVSFTVVSDNQLSVHVPGGLTANSTVTVTTAAGSVESADELVVLADNTRTVLAADFESDLDGFTAVSVASDADWALGEFSGDGYVAMNGFGADVASDDFLVSPEIDLSGIGDAVLSFTTARRFGGPALKVFVSTDYDSSKSVNDASQNWVELTGFTLSEDNYDVVVSGPISLAAYFKKKIHLAFEYTSSGTGSGEGAVIQLHDVLVTSGPWKFDAAYDWNYAYAGSGWVYSISYGAIYVAQEGFIYHPHFGWFYIGSANGSAVLLYSLAAGEWVYQPFSNGAWFYRYTSAMWDNFIIPQS